MEDGQSKQKAQSSSYLLSECGASTAIQCLKELVLGWEKKGREWIGVKVEWKDADFWRSIATSSPSISTVEK